MKKLLVLAALLTAPFAAAQETYSISASAAQVTDLTQIVAVANERVCFKLNLAEGCTQAQACVASAAPGDSSCTAAQARQANVRIIPATQAGREEFVTFFIAGPRFIEMRSEIVSRHKEKFCAFWATATQTQKNTLCTDSGQSTGCELCP